MLRRLAIHVHHTMLSTVDSAGLEQQVKHGERLNADFHFAHSQSLIHSTIGVAASERINDSLLELLSLPTCQRPIKYVLKANTHIFRDCCVKSKQGLINTLNTPVRSVWLIPAARSHKRI